MKGTPEYYKSLLQLKPHPEGGDYAAYYRSEDNVKIVSTRYGKSDLLRPEGTSIYYMLSNEQFSAFHEINSPEIWHYYTGNTPIYLHCFEKNGTLSLRILGDPAITESASFQIVIQANQIFAAELPVKNQSSFALVGCTVSPGFTFDDFKLNSQKELLSKYPQHAKIIKQFST